MQSEENKVDDDNSRSKVDALSSDSERFYEKLGEFFDSTGLSLIFNVRETILDLFLLYKEVTNRGGYHQITNKGVWSDIVLALKLEAKDSNLATQLQRLYANLLYQFEQTYITNAPRQLTGFAGYKNSVNKLDIGGSSRFLTDNINGPPPVQKKMRIEPVVLPGTVSKDQKPKCKEAKKDPNAPTGLRSAYQIFLKMECDRLKSINGALDGKNIRKMAVDTWRRLSEKEKQPYIEESRKDRERFKREMAAYEESKNSEVDAQNKKPDKDVYNVVVGIGQEAENSPVPDQSMVDLAIKMMKNAPSEDLLRVNWDEFSGELDFTD